MKIEKYGASWCGPCQALDKTLKIFSERHPEVDVIRFDIDELDQDYLDTLKIRTIPVIRIMDESGNEVKRFTGAQSLMVLENELS